MADETRKLFAEHREEAIAAGRKIFIDGLLWRVYELGEAPYDRRGSTTLVFESSYVIRRVRKFPENWRELDTNALIDLSQRP